MTGFRPSPVPTLSGLLLLAHLASAIDVDYRLVARLDETSRSVLGTVRVSLRNDSTGPLDGFWLQLRPNAFRTRDNDFARKLKRMARYDLDWLARLETGGIDVSNPTWDGNRIELPADSVRPVAWVELSTPLLPGDSGVLEAAFTTRIPGFFASWLGNADRCYVVADWYPKLAPARASPPWSGDCVVELHVPHDMTVGSSGSPARTQDPAPGTPADGLRRSDFSAHGVTDFAWVAAPGLLVLRDSAGSLELEYLARPGRQAAARVELSRIRSIAASFASWYGPPRVPKISVFDASGLVPEDWSCPGLSVIAEGGIPLTRMRERALARQLAGHWFPPASGPERVAFSWLSDGAAVYSEMRYLEAAHGRDNLLTVPTLGLLDGLGDDYYNHVTYYLAASNGLLAPLGYPYLSDRLSVADAQPSQAGRFMQGLERTMGRAAFDRAVRRYRAGNPEPGPEPAAFASACSSEHGGDPADLFGNWLADWRIPGTDAPRTGPTCDYRLVGVRRRGEDVEACLERVGDVTMPVDVEFVLADGTAERRTWRQPERRGVVRVTTPARVRRVTLDPDGKLLEVNRWNNHWPRRVDIHPVFALPSFDAYQLFYGPYAWYDGYNGWQLAGWLQGRQFIDLGPVRGRHMWTLTETYCTRLRAWTTNAWYQTPLGIVSDRLRLSCLAKHSRLQTRLNAKLVGGLSPVFRQAGATIELGYEFLELADLRGRDPRAWDSARTAEVNVNFLHDYRAGRFRGNLLAFFAVGRTELGGSDDYLRIGIETAHGLRLGRGSGVRLRLFAGAIPGSIPDQNQFYLSGSLVPTQAEPVTWAYQGAASGQEHWHFDGDVNCRGYAGDYLHGRFAYGLNLELIPLPFVQPFFDIGNVGDEPDDPGFWRPRMDAGIKLKLGPLYAAFPAWRCRVGDRPEFTFRWMLGLNLSGLTDF